MSVVLSQFARRRLFTPRTGGTVIQDCSADAFERHLADHEPIEVLDGYAPFCKLLVYRNWTATRCGTLEITPENEAQLRSAYEARTDDELPVLVRWFDGLEPPLADYLLVIVYSQAQMALEGDPIDADWGVVGCLATREPVETPMAPITMMRNALGVEEGGSGVPLDREAYRRSVEFWSRHANCRPGASD